MVDCRSCLDTTRRRCCVLSGRQHGVIVAKGRVWLAVGSPSQQEHPQSSTAPDTTSAVDGGVMETALTDDASAQRSAEGVKDAAALASFEQQQAATSVGEA